MLVVLANRADATAAGLVSAWASQDAALLTAEDLSRAGWRHHPGAKEASTAVIGGRVVAVREIEAVLTRLPCVTEADLPHIVAEDRSYVAMEMTSFLVAWLSALECTVINKPRPACLVGPNWREAEWVRLAAELGMRVRTLRRECAPGASFVPPVFEGVPAAVTIIGKARFGFADETLKDQAGRLAQAAGVDLLTVFFTSASASSAEFLGVSLCPDLSSSDAAGSVLELLTGGVT
ncbi:MAG: hypothetical protein AABO41_17105 [Acidobacteriota bacterium]